MTLVFDLLKELSELIGPSGKEQSVQKFILEQVKEYVDEYEIDPLGNLIVYKKGNEKSFPSLLLSAHSDEIGFIVKKIESNGFIRFELLGGFDPRILPSQPIWIQSEKGTVNGVIGTLSGHYVKWDDPKRISSHRDLYIDIGANSQEEVAKMGVKIGQAISYGTQLQFLGNKNTKRVVGKALDDRVGSLLLIKLFQGLEELKGGHGDVYGAFTVQEEVGLRGASILTPRIKPDFALALDTTPTSDTEDVLMKGTRKLGKGPCIKVVDKYFIAHPLIVNQLEKLAIEKNIPHQMEVFMGIGTDAGAMHMTGQGTSTGALSIPSRYTHSAIEVVDMNDLKNTLDLLELFVENMDQLKNKTFLDT